MDIKAQIEQIVDKVKNDKNFQAEFQKNPVKAVESVAGVDLPDDMINKVVDGVKTKVSVDKLTDSLGGIKKLF